MTARALTIRLPFDLYEESREIAQEHKVSINMLILDCLRRSVQERAEKKLYEAFSIIAEDPEEANVEFAMAAQQEVINNDH
jgi:hypothetical protein